MKVTIHLHLKLEITWDLSFSIASNNIFLSIYGINTQLPSWSKTWRSQGVTDEIDSLHPVSGKQGVQINTIARFIVQLEDSLTSKKKNLGEYKFADEKDIMHLVWKIQSNEPCFIWDTPLG